MVAIVEEHRGPMGLVIERGHGFESHPIAYYSYHTLAPLSLSRIIWNIS